MMGGRFTDVINMDGLSDDGKAIAGCWFGLMTPKSDLTFQMEESKPAPRTAAALAELVDRGVISVEPLNKHGGLVYRPLVDCQQAFRWFMKNAERPEINFRLTVPLAQKDPAP
jgi:hypothetical protein